MYNIGMASTTENTAHNNNCPADKGCTKLIEMAQWLVVTCTTAQSH